MSVAPSPSSSRGEVILQPAYFTSSAFVHAARADIDCMLRRYSQQYSHSRNNPFTAFKEIWQTQGWSWIQFKVFDTRSRAAFLRVMMRLFAERVGGGETLLSRVAALFGLYTIFRTQPSTSAPLLYSTAQVEVTCDLYGEIATLPDTLDGEFLLPVRPYVVYVQSELLRAHAFQILPHAETYPLSPRTLPREVVGEDVSMQGVKKKGRPSKREKTKRARESLTVLDGLCENASELRPSETRERYATAKRALVGAVGGDLEWVEALREVTDRIEVITGLIE